ncbi:MAG: DivIVA domain-containing protein, partial [Ruminococcus sp.]|nr:DivIVA domain-containing protein [Ruminococcus sp.]
TMEQMKKEKSDLVKKMDILATRVEEYRADEDAVRNAMLASQRVADSTIKSAKAKAAQIIEESENAAKAKLYDLNLQIKEQKKQYALLLSECNKLREELISVCNKHIISAKELPSKTKVEIIGKQIEDRFPTDNSDDIERADEVMQAPVTAEATAEDVVEDANIAEEVVVNNTSQPVAGIDATDDNGDNPAVAEFFNSEVNLIDDINDTSLPESDVTIAEKKKKSKLFGVLKFGDDYNIEDDNDNDK